MMKKGMQIRSLFDKGSADHVEDFHLVHLPFCVVADGVSPPYSKGHPLLMIGGHTAGAVVAKTVCDTFANANPQELVRTILTRANAQVGALAQQCGCPLDRPDLLAGASVAVVKLTDSVEVANIADAFVLWRFVNGQVGATASSNFEHEQYLLEIVARIMEEVKGDRQAMWERYYDTRCASLRQHTNRRIQLGYSILNGQPELVPLISIQQFPLGMLQNMIVCSDGLVPFSLIGNPEQLAEWVFRAYDQGGLGGVLSLTREYEEEKKGRSHESYAEATAIAIDF